MKSQPEQSGDEGNQRRLLGLVYGPYGIVVQEDDGSLRLICDPSERMDDLLEHDLPFLRGFRDMSRQLISGELTDAQGAPIPPDLGSDDALVAFSSLLARASRREQGKLIVTPAFGLGAE